MDGTAGAQVIQLGVDGDDLVFKTYDGTTVLTLDDDSKVGVAADLTVGDDICFRIRWCASFVWRRIMM